MSDANELHPVGLVASSVDPTIKSATSAPVGSDPNERFKALEGLASTYWTMTNWLCWKRPFALPRKCMLAKSVNRAKHS